MGIKKLGENKLAQRGLALALTAVLVAVPLNTGLWRQSLTSDQLKVRSLKEELKNTFKHADDAYSSYVAFSKASGLVSEEDLTILKTYMDNAKAECPTYVKEICDHYDAYVEYKRKLDASLEIVDISLNDAYAYVEQAKNSSGPEHDELIDKALRKIAFAEKSYEDAGNYYEKTRFNITISEENCLAFKQSLGCFYRKMSFVEDNLERTAHFAEVEDLLTDIEKLDEELTRKVNAGEDYSEDARDLAVKLWTWKIYESYSAQNTKLLLGEYEYIPRPKRFSGIEVDEDGNATETYTEYGFQSVDIMFEIENTSNSYTREFVFDYRVEDDGDLLLWDPTYLKDACILYESKAEVSRFSAVCNADDKTLASEARLKTVCQEKTKLMEDNVNKMSEAMGYQVFLSFNKMQDYEPKFEEYKAAISQAKEAVQLEQGTTIAEDAVPLSPGASLPGSQFTLLLIFIGVVALAVGVGLGCLLTCKKS